jgi:hypothetical protein
VRRGKGGRRREVGMDRWGCQHLHRGSRSGPRCRSDCCCASSTVRRLIGIGSNPPHESSCDEPPRQLAYAVDSRRTSVASAVHAHPRRSGALSEGADARAARSDARRAIAAARRYLGRLSRAVWARCGGGRIAGTRCCRRRR